ncbi:MAG: sttH [Rhodoferax sp.]|nr:sttH [Rhodoferax sp.]
MRKALLVIDLQNDYFPGGNYPLWQPEAALARVLEAMGEASTAGVPVVLVQHVADAAKGVSPFFNAGSEGVRIHPAVLAAAPGAPVVIKGHADSFRGTTLESTLDGLGIDSLLICGMMTQNCVTHTAVSRTAERYAVTVLGDACATVDQMVHGMALNALAPRVPVMSAEDAFRAFKA